jgi:hypothetical protein
MDAQTARRKAGMRAMMVGCLIGMLGGLIAAPLGCDP